MEKALIANFLLVHINLVFNQFQQFPSGSGGAKSKKPICPICGKAGHIAIDCYHRMDYVYQGKHPPIKLAVMATASYACSTQD